MHVYIYTLAAHTVVWPPLGSAQGFVITRSSDVSTHTNLRNRLDSSRLTFAFVGKRFLRAERDNKCFARVPRKFRQQGFAVRCWNGSAVGGFILAGDRLPGKPWAHFKSSD